MSQKWDYNAASQEYIHIKRPINNVVKYLLPFLVFGGRFRHVTDGRLYETTYQPLQQSVAIAKKRMVSDNVPIRYTDDYYVGAECNSMLSGLMSQDKVKKGPLGCQHGVNKE